MENKDTEMFGKWPIPLSRKLTEKEKESLAAEVLEVPDMKDVDNRRKKRYDGRNLPRR